MGTVLSIWGGSSWGLTIMQAQTLSKGESSALPGSELLGHMVSGKTVGLTDTFLKICFCWTENPWRAEEKPRRLLLSDGYFPQTLCALQDVTVISPWKERLLYWTCLEKLWGEQVKCRALQTLISSYTSWVSKWEREHAQFFKLIWTRYTFPPYRNTY